jgi:hypothetical protein
LSPQKNKPPDKPAAVLLFTSVRNTQFLKNHSLAAELAMLSQVRNATD